MMFFSILEMFIPFYFAPFLHAAVHPHTEIHPPTIDILEATGKVRPPRIDALVRKALNSADFSGWAADYNPENLHRASVGWPHPDRTKDHKKAAYKRLLMQHDDDLKAGAISKETLRIAADKGFTFHVRYSCEVLDFVVFLYPLAGKKGCGHVSN